MIEKSSDRKLRPVWVFLNRTVALVLLDAISCCSVFFVLAWLKEQSKNIYLSFLALCCWSLVCSVAGECIKFCAPKHEQQTIVSIYFSFMCARIDFVSRKKSIWDEEWRNGDTKHNTLINLDRRICFVVILALFVIFLIFLVKMVFGRLQYAILWRLFFHSP